MKQRSTTRQDTIRATFAEEPPDTGTTSAQSTTRHTPTNDIPDLVSETTTTQKREQSTRAVQREPSVSQRNNNREPSTTQRDSMLTAPPAAAVPTPTEVSGLPSPSPYQRSTRANKGTFQKPRFMDEVYLNSLDCFANPGAHQAQLAYLAEMLTCPDSGIVNIDDPRVYAAKVHGGDADNPTFQQAMNGPDSVEYLKAMKLEVDTLVEHRTWECVPQKKGMT